MKRVITVVEKEGTPWLNMMSDLEGSAALELEHINGRLVCNPKHPTLLAVIADCHITRDNIEAWLLEPKIDEYSAQGLDDDGFDDRIGVTRSDGFVADPLNAEFGEDCFDDPENPHGLHFFYLLVDDAGCFSDEDIIRMAASSDRCLDSEDKLSAECLGQLRLAAS